MKKCQHCGTNVNDNEFVCPNCGSKDLKGAAYADLNGQNQQSNYDENEVIGILSIVFGFLFPIVGLILAIVGLVKYESPKNRKCAKIGLVVSIVFPIVIAFLYVGLIVYIFTAIGNAIGNSYTAFL